MFSCERRLGLALRRAEITFNKSLLASHCAQREGRKSDYFEKGLVCLVPMLLPNKAADLKLVYIER
jgi:hypothetical protein